ncbi:ATP-binding protein [Lentisalinibacter sediminis]|uniref:ATP-binding protein n=1 Tax=Lentisalinibacter sediminis TaxID=2992237 RepID=UPI0038681936
MAEYRRIALLILTMTVVVTVATAVSIGVLYDTAFERQRQQLVDSAHTLARLIEQMSEFDQRYRHDYPGSAAEATLAQIRQAFTHEHTIRGSAEVTLGRREGDDIVFLMRHHHAVGGPPAPVPWGSSFSQPMHRALSGERGTMIGSDYHGTRVLAAYDAVDVLGLGVVAKIDLAEIRAPFFRAGALVLTVALALIGAATLLFLRLGNPMVRALHEREERLRLILASTGEGIFGMDLDGRCTFANRAAVHQLGYGGEAELLGRDIHELIHHTHPDGSPHPRDECPAARAISHGESLQLDDEMLWRNDGTGFPAEYRTRPMRRDGEIIGAVVSFVDTTERRERELELAHARKMEVLGRLTGGIAHDFNNLLTVILGNLRLLKRRVRSGDTEAAELIDDAVSAAEDGSGLIQQLLAFSRKQTLKPETIDLGVFLRDNRRFLERVAADGVEITLDTDTGSLPVQADIQQLQSALLNLTINASDAMPGGGGLRIAARREEIRAGSSLDMASGPCVTLSITDTGEGMSAEVLARAIEPFFTTKGPGKGSGLGLSMVYGFVRQSGGDLRMDSEPGGGTTVTLYFPEAAEAQPHDDTVRPAGPQAAPAETILVVEDEARLRRYAARTLSAAGYRVLEASGIVAARELLMKQTEVALLFTDIVMPGGTSGLELADWVGRHYPGTGILLTTGYSDQAARAVDGGYSILSKPYGETDLLAAVRQALSDSHSVAAPG